MTMTETARWHGMDAARVYQMYAQTEHWIDQQGESHRLKAMDTRYLRTVRRFMERNGPAHCMAALWGIPEPRMNGDMAQFFAEHEFMQMLDTLMDWAESRMRKAPLYRAVCAELHERRRLARTYKVRHWTDLGVHTYREAVPF